MLFGYFFLAAALKLVVMPNFKELVKKKSELSGNYRTAHGGERQRGGSGGSPEPPGPLS